MAMLLRFEYAGDNDPLLINPDHIVTVYPATEGGVWMGLTTVDSGCDGGCASRDIRVKGTVDSVEKLVNSFCLLHAPLEKNAAPR